MMPAHRILRQLTPPLLLEGLRHVLRRQLRFVGDYANWGDARRDASGYDSEAIVERVAAATREVLAGRAAFERDSVLFTEPDYPFALLAGLLLAAARHGGELDVIDFGGALGGSYRQCLPFLKRLNRLNWTVVEQPVFVQRGQAEFTTDQLRFSTEVPLGPRTSAVLLASSVLQYIEEPETVLGQFAATGASHLVIDRTPMRADTSRNQICVQQVPAGIYKASYPCWIFSREWLLARLSPDWEVVADFPCAEGRRSLASGEPFDFKGLILERRT